jgi:hypothetical protein
MSDWYQTVSAKKVGFTARPVVGGVFAEMLYDAKGWQKYARRDRTKAANWAPMPKLPKVTTVVPAADQQPAVWKYTTSKPAADWHRPEFDAGNWKEGQSGFGTRGTPGSEIGTRWDTQEIWLRREITLPSENLKNLQIWLHHDEDVEIFINGVPALNLAGFTGSYDAFALAPTAKAALKPGKNLIAVHCRQTNGGQYIDLGFVLVSPQ